MMEQGLTPVEISFNTVIDACASCRKTPPKPCSDSVGYGIMQGWSRTS
jgi:hypothetical protein